MRRLVPVLAGLCACASLRAQSVTPDTSEIAPGDAIRVTAPVLGLKDWHGYLVSAVPDSVKVRSADSVAFTIPISEITEFLVNHGNRAPQGNAGVGAIVGGLGGAIVGVLAGTSSEDAGCFDVDAFLEDCTQTQYRNGLIGAGIGVVIGAGIGALIRTTPWQYVPVVPPPAVTTRVAPNGATVVAIGFRF
jgi:hypothetical protein